MGKGAGDNCRGAMSLDQAMPDLGQDLRAAQQRCKELQAQIQQETNSSLKNFLEFDLRDAQDQVLIEKSLLDARQLYGEPEMGRTRACFMLPDGKHVLKVPLDDEGMSQNGIEADWDDPYIPLAKCSLRVNAHGIAELIMERVEPTMEDGLPEWVGMVDCAQVGYTADGRLVAYDL